MLRFLNVMQDSIKNIFLVVFGTGFPEMQELLSCQNLNLYEGALRQLLNGYG